MTPNKLADCIYDILCEMGLDDTQIDAYAEMKRDFAKESRQALRTYIKDKYLSIEAGTIQIGERKPITIKFNK